MTPDGQQQAEIDWWSSLEGEDMHTNTAGVPAYDPVSVAARVLSVEDPFFTPYRALDIGCGVGRLTNYMGGICDWVTGIDIAPQMIDVARADAPKNVEYLLGTGRDLPKFDKPFDLVYAVTVFQHIPLDATISYIKQAIDLLQWGGHMVFTLPGIDDGQPDTTVNHPLTSGSYAQLLLTLASLPVNYFKHDNVADANGWRWIRISK